MAEIKSFSTKRDGTPIEIDGEVHQLVLLTGTDIGKYRKTMGNRVKYGTNGRPQGMTNYEGLESSLVTLCLIDGSGKNVPMATIDRWPQAVIKALFEMCLDMNGLNEKEKEKDEKND